MINDLNVVKQKNYNLSIENQNLNDKISQLQFQNSTLSNLLNFNNFAQNPNNVNQALINLSKNNQELIDTINRYPLKLEKNEKLISVIIQTLDQKVLYPIMCKNTDSFFKLENELHKVYPNIQFSKYFYSFNGNAIKDKSQTLEQNKIKNGDILLVKEINSSGKFN